MEEHAIVVDGDVLVGNYAELGFGIIAKLVVAGEHVKITGNIVSDEEVRIDMWSEITGDAVAKTDAYLGEYVTITGKLVVAGDLNVGHDVKINGGYDVKGYLTVRRPLPVYLFLIFYLMTLLSMGREEEVEKAMEELFSEDESGNKVMSIPDRTKITLDMIKTLSSAYIGSHCKLMGNIRARSVSLGNHNTLFGSVRSVGEITAGGWNTIHGNIVSKKKVYVGRNSRVLGKITAASIILHETARVDGALAAEAGTILERDDIEGLDDDGKKLFYGFTLLEAV